MVKQVIIIRHGETEKDKSNPERDLTPNGKQQIIKTSKEIRKFIQGSKIALITTNFKRSIHSGEIIKKELAINEKTIRYNDLIVENINSLNPEMNLDLTFSYFKSSNDGMLPSNIPTPQVVAQRFLDLIAATVGPELLIIVSHSGAIESFINYQNQYISNKRIKKELKYGEFVVLERQR